MSLQLLSGEKVYVAEIKDEGIQESGAMLPCCHVALELAYLQTAIADQAHADSQQVTSFHSTN